MTQDLNVPQRVHASALYSCHLAGRPLTILEDSQSLKPLCHPFCEITTVIHFSGFRTPTRLPRIRAGSFALHRPVPTTDEFLGMHQPEAQERLFRRFSRLSHYGIDDLHLIQCLTGDNIVTEIGIADHDIKMILPAVSKTRLEPPLILIPFRQKLIDVAPSHLAITQSRAKLQLQGLVVDLERLFIRAGRSYRRILGFFKIVPDINPAITPYSFVTRLSTMRLSSMIRGRARRVWLESPSHPDQRNSRPRKFQQHKPHSSIFYRHDPQEQRPHDIQGEIACVHLAPRAGGD